MERRQNTSDAGITVDASRHVSCGGTGRKRQEASEPCVICPISLRESWHVNRREQHRERHSWTFKFHNGWLVPTKGLRQTDQTFKPDNSRLTYLWTKLTSIFHTYLGHILSLRLAGAEAISQQRPFNLRKNMTSVETPMHHPSIACRQPSPYYWLCASERNVLNRTQAFKWTRSVLALCLCYCMKYGYYLAYSLRTSCSLFKHSSAQWKALKCIFTIQNDYEPWGKHTKLTFQ